MHPQISSIALTIKGEFKPPRGMDALLVDVFLAGHMNHRHMNQFPTSLIQSNPHKPKAQ